MKLTSELILKSSTDADVVLIAKTETFRVTATIHFGDSSDANAMESEIRRFFKFINMLEDGA